MRVKNRMNSTSYLGKGIWNVLLVTLDLSQRKVICYNEKEKVFYLFQYQLLCHLSGY